MEIANLRFRLRKCTRYCRTFFTTRKVLIFLIASLPVLGGGCAGWLHFYGEPDSEAFRRKILRESITVLRNEGNLLPLSQESARNSRLILLRDSSGLKPFLESALFFEEELSFAQVNYLGLDSAAFSTFPKELAKQPQNSESSHLIFVLDSLTGLDARFFNNFFKYKQSNQQVVLAILDNPRKLPLLSEYTNALSGIILGLNNSREAQEFTAQIIFGGLPAKGKLSDTYGNFKDGSGILTKATRLGFSRPEDERMSSQSLARIDSLMAEAMRGQATPGGQVLVAKNGRIVYEKSFGFHTYDSLTSVQLTDLYDLASVTKITSALPALMKLDSEGLFETDSTLGYYLPFFKDSNKDSLRMIDILTHQARLRPYLAFWQKYYSWRAKKLYPKYFAVDSSGSYPTKIAHGLYGVKDFYKDKMMPYIRRSKLLEKPGYRYSGVAFLLLPRIVDSLAPLPYEAYLQQEFLKPLGAGRLCFGPRRFYSAAEIVPTEYDSVFRNQLIHGFVHDEAASLMGGFSANAGMFSNARDLAKMLQMYLQNGSYGGRSYIDEETIQRYTSCVFCADSNRRGIGFDKPLIEYNPDNTNTCEAASPSSFGHLGFTGTMVWVDPEYDLVYIFLSNRVYPSRENKKLIELNTRTEIQRVIYESVMPEEKSSKGVFFEF